MSFLSQRLEAEERERKRLERLRLKEEEKMNEEIDLYERGLCARFADKQSASFEILIMHRPFPQPVRLFL